MALVDLLYAGLPQAFNLLKTNKQAKTVSAKHNKGQQKYAHAVTELSTFLVLSQFLLPAPGGSAVGTGASVQISPE